MPKKRPQQDPPKTFPRTRAASTPGDRYREALRCWRRSATRRLLLWPMVGLSLLFLLNPIFAQDAANLPGRIDGASVATAIEGDPKTWVESATGSEGLSSTIQIMLLLTVISLAPAVLLMTTSFVRIVVVLGLLRQALGTQNLPPSQVITSIALFMSLLIMTPVWKQVYEDAILPYSEGRIDPSTNQPMSLDEVWTRGQAPVRRFMSAQINRTENADDVRIFLDYMEPASEDPDAAAMTYVYYGANEEAGERNVPMQALLPGFILSELKTAFLIGFKIYLPFLVLDMVIASVMISMGMLMLPPVMISLPFKLLLFVLVDGWHLVVEMLLKSFEPFM